ncbi:MAG TPA: hypothetical protein VF064_00725 [Pyrinomonadaceae bacterium]
MPEDTPDSGAKVTLDADTASKMESVLRDGLSGSQAYIADDEPDDQGKKKAASVELDAPTVAQFADHLKERLSASGAYIAEDDAGEGAEKK